MNLKKVITCSGRDFLRSSAKLFSVFNYAIMSFFLYQSLVILQHLVGAEWRLDDVTILGKTNKGHYKTIGFDLQKIPPPVPQRDMTYLVGVTIDAELTKGLMIGRRLAPLGGIDIYVVGEVNHGPVTGLGVKAGAVITF